MAPLFGQDENMKEIGKNMQNLSEQIGTLQQQLAERNTQVEQLQQRLNSAESQTNQSDQAAKQLQAAQAQVQTLQQQIAQLQAQISQQAAPGQKSGSAWAQEAAPAQQTAPAGGTTLSVGSSAWVTQAGGLPLRLRSQPGLAKDTVIDRLPPGTQMTLLEGPQPHDNHLWWRIRTTDGREGWVAGEDLRTQPD